MNELVRFENKEIVVSNEAIEKLKNFKKVKDELDLLDKQLKQELKEAMEQVGLKKFIVNGLCATIKNESTRVTLDTKKLKEEMPDIYEEYSKEIPVASSITLTIAE